MADTWKCSICYVTLRCSCSSMECGFDYDIKAHVRQDLKRALELNSMWWDQTKAMLSTYVTNIIEEIE